MPRYGSVGAFFTLLHHTPSEWAEIRKAQLVNLGCSEEYAESVVKIYREAEA